MTSHNETLHELVPLKLGETGRGGDDWHRLGQPSKWTSLVLLLFLLVIIIGVFVPEFGRLWDRLVAPLLHDVEQILGQVETYLRSLCGVPAGYPS